MDYKQMQASKIEKDAATGVEITAGCQQQNQLKR